MWMLEDWLEQEEAVESLLKGRNVCCLQAWKKPVIFQLFVLVKSRASKSPNACSVKRPTVIVICLLKSFPFSGSFRQLNRNSKGFKKNQNQMF